MDVECTVMVTTRVVDALTGTMMVVEVDFADDFVVDSILADTIRAFVAD